MVSAALWPSSAESFLYCNSGKSADFPELPFPGRGRKGQRKLSRKHPRPLSHRYAMPAPPKGEPLAVHANFISLPRPLPLRKSPAAPPLPTEAGAAAAVCGYDPSCENAFGALRRARQTRNKNHNSAVYAQQRRRPPPVAETGRSCWGSGQQDASAVQGTMRMLGAATRKKRSAFKSFFRTPPRRPDAPAGHTAMPRRTG